MIPNLSAKSHRTLGPTRSDSMAQQTTCEFGRRLQQALDASPHVVPMSHGRLSWLKREREKIGVSVSVSVNTLHKWVHGVSRPREDTIRALARLLRVDDIWLAPGQTPTRPRD